MAYATRVAVSYNTKVGGRSARSLMSAFIDAGCAVTAVDYRKIMQPITDEEFAAHYPTVDGRKKLLAHAKAEAAKILDKFDCLALPGNTCMIDPVLFGEQQTTRRYDQSRTLAELALIHVATQRGMPIMGICGGHQVVAVYGGGHIREMTPDEARHHIDMAYDDIIFNTESKLAAILRPKTARQSVFGGHEQVVKSPGRGFAKAATGSDRTVIEATESIHGAPAFTTQFHPEIMMKGLEASGSLTRVSPGTVEQANMSKKLFDYFRGAGEAYHYKQVLMAQLKSGEKPILRPVDKSKEKSILSPVDKKVAHETGSSFWRRYWPELLGAALILAAVAIIFFPPAAALPVIALLAIKGVAALAVLGLFIKTSITAIKAVLAKYSGKKQHMPEPDLYPENPAQTMTDEPAQSWGQDKGCSYQTILESAPPGEHQGTATETNPPEAITEAPKPNPANADEHAGDRAHRPSGRA